MKIEKTFPECKDYLWGGTKLKEKYGKITDKSPCAESWELSFHKDGPTRIADGRLLADVVTKSDIGTKASTFPFFPVLIKFIDAKADLSVQVHPSDEYALKNENSFGKTEMWYIVEAELGAGIYLGLKNDISHEELKDAIFENRLTDLLNFIEVKSGDCFFIPSRTIHAIGKGCLICEIQQNSNLTYRVYDYGRVDKNGNTRELHVEKALAVSSLQKFEKAEFDGNVLGECEYFTVTKHSVNGEMKFTATEESFNAVTCVGGEGQINGEKINRGDTFFIPAGYGDYTICGNLEIIFTKV